MRWTASLLLLPLSLAPARPVTAANGHGALAAGTILFTPTRIDPAIRNVLGFRARTGRASPLYQRNARFEREGAVPVVIRFRTANDAIRYARLAPTPLASGAHAAYVTAAELALLEADPAVTRVSCNLAPVMMPMLDASAVETGVAMARPALRKKDGTELDGRGIKIADIDSGVLVYHPALFRADGGVHRWVDVNGDGQLTAGVDGVDLDADGVIAQTETLRPLIVDSPVRNGPFDAGVDYLFVDTNRNGDRDYGRDFREDTPALGEPIFVVDDVDRDGKLALSERLLRLGTSKVAAVLTESRTYTRGNTGSSGINTYGISLLRSEDAHRYANHGTSVAGILVGGVPERSKLLGLAPGAELITAVSGEWTTTVQWAIDQKADVILSEFGSYVGHPLDGSSEDDAMFDAAVAKGIAVVNPAGNLADAYKHRSVKLAAGATSIPLKTEYGFGGAPLIAFTLLYRGEPRMLSIKLTLADGSVVAVPADSTEAPVSLEKNRLLDVTRRVSARGTHEVHFSITALSDSGYGKMPSGRYTLAIEADAEVDVELFCKDSNTSWGYGLVFESNTVARTICHPATNDSGISLAAYTLHGDAGEIAGTIAKYSSSGPRIDGTVGIDLAAPANPWTAAVPPDPTYRSVHYEQFSGTSGAGPHVAAALALLKQLNPGLSGAELQKMLLSRARRDSFVGDEHRWGRGKLDLLGALELPRTETAPPRVRLSFPRPAPLGREIDLKVDIDAPGTPPLRARWDLDDDGKPDSDWAPLTQKTLRSDRAASRDVKLEVIDAAGHLAGTTARVVFADVKAPDPVTPPDPAPPKSTDGGCGCATNGHERTGGIVGALFVVVAGLRRRRCTPSRVVTGRCR